jgi:hypothetical protein
MRDITATYRRLIGIALVAMLLLGTGLSLTGCNMTAQDSMEDPYVDTGLERGTAEMDVESLDAAAPEEFTEEAVAGAGEDASTVPAEDRLVIMNTGVRVKVDDVAASIEEIRSITSDASGTISAMQVSSDEDPVYRYEAEGTLADGAPLAGYVTARVPADRLDAYVDQIKELGEVVRIEASESDVTQEYIDLSARLTNLEAREARLRELYAEADTVEDTLAVDRELSAVRSDIEAMKAQIAYLERQAAMATVTIELTEPAPIVRPEGEDWGFGDALTSAARAFMGMVNGIIVVVGALLPLGIIFLVIAGVVWLIARAVHRRSTTRAEEDDAQK